MALYEQMLGLGGGGGGGKVSDIGDLIAAFGGEEIPEEALIKMEELYAELGIDAEALFGGVDPESAFIKMEDLEEGLIKWIEPTSGDLDEAFAKVEFDEGVLDKLGGPLSVAEAALAQAAADGDIDQATLEAILGMLPDE
jgi:hypothetical protein